MNARRSILLLLVLALGLSLPGRAGASDWKKIKSQDGITVSKRPVAGTNIVALKGEGIVEASLQKVLFVLIDNDHRADWVDRMVESTVVERVSDFEYVVYHHFALPPLFADREYVYRGRASRNAKTGEVSLLLKSEEHPNAPPADGVRAELVKGRYVLTPISADRVAVKVEILTDPKGLLPAWLVNLIQESWPLETLRGIRRQVKEPYVKPYPLPPPA